MKNPKFLLFFCLLLFFNIIFFFGCFNNSIDDSVAPTQTNYPDGAIFHQRIVELASVPDSFSAAVCWFQAATMTQTQNDTAMIVIDYMKWIEIDNSTGNETVLGIENYDQTPPRPLTENEGGLYLRNPQWFPPGDVHTPIDASTISNGYLYLDISQHKDRIYHWWTPRFSVQPNKKYAFELRLKVIGKTAIQGGMDWWRTLTAPYGGFNVNNRESFVGDWHGATNDFVVIRESL